MPSSRKACDSKLDSRVLPDSQVFSKRLSPTGYALPAPRGPPRVRERVSGAALRSDDVGEGSRLSSPSSGCPRILLGGIAEVCGWNGGGRAQSSSHTSACPRAPVRAPRIQVALSEGSAARRSWSCRALDAGGVVGYGSQRSIRPGGNTAIHWIEARRDPKAGLCARRSTVNIRMRRRVVNLTRRLRGSAGEGLQTLALTGIPRRADTPHH
jgi:hypothetical protein